MDFWPKKVQRMEIFGWQLIFSQNKLKIPKNFSQKFPHAVLAKNIIRFHNRELLFIDSSKGLIWWFIFIILVIVNTFYTCVHILQSPRKVINLCLFRTTLLGLFEGQSKNAIHHDDQLYIWKFWSLTVLIINCFDH